MLYLVAMDIQRSIGKLIDDLLYFVEFRYDDFLE